MFFFQPKEEKTEIITEGDNVIKMEIDSCSDMKKETDKEKEKLKDGTGEKDVGDESLVIDGEVTVRRVCNNSTSNINGDSGINGADKENTSPDRSLDDEVKIEVIKQEQQDKSQSIDDFDPMKVLEWDTKGVGKLPGSDLKVTKL